MKKLLLSLGALSAVVAPVAAVVACGSHHAEKVKAGTPSGTPAGTPAGTPSGTPSGTPAGTPVGTDTTPSEATFDAVSKTLSVTVNIDEDNTDDFGKIVEDTRILIEALEDIDNTFDIDTAGITSLEMKFIKGNSKETVTKTVAAGNAKGKLNTAIMVAVDEVTKKPGFEALDAAAYNAKVLAGFKGITTAPKTLEEANEFLEVQDVQGIEIVTVPADTTKFLINVGFANGATQYDSITDALNALGINAIATNDPNQKQQVVEVTRIFKLINA